MSRSKLFLAAPLRIVSLIPKACKNFAWIYKLTETVKPTDFRFLKHSLLFTAFFRSKRDVPHDYYIKFLSRVVRRILPYSILWDYAKRKRVSERSWSSSGPSCWLRCSQRQIWCRWRRLRRSKGRRQRVPRMRTASTRWSRSFPGTTTLRPKASWYRAA